MSVEMACGKCEGRFLVAAPGTVACPHCGTHLSVGADVFPSENVPVATVPVENVPQPQAEVPSPVAADEQAVQSAAPTLPQDSTEPSGEADFRNWEPSQPGELVIDTGTAQQTGAVVDGESESIDEQQLQTDATAADQAVSAAIPVASEPADAPAETAGTQDGEGQVAPAVPSTSEPVAVPDGEAKTVTLAHFNPSEGAPPVETPTEVVEGAVSGFGDNFAGEGVPGEIPDFSAPSDDTAAADINAMLDNAENANADNQIPLSTSPVSPEIQPPPVVQPQSVTQPQPFIAAEPAASMTKTVPRGVPTRWFIILASYASAMTIVCLWLLLRVMGGTHSLENLSDPADPPVQGKMKSVSVYKRSHDSKNPVDLVLPPGHVLRLGLGDQRRYGNIVVEPIKVTRGPLDFVHFAGEKGPVKESTAPVLKLWLRFKNVSDDQTIAPLDSILLYTNRTRSEKNYEEFSANNFVYCRDKKSGGQLLHVFDLNTNDEWDLKDQHLGKKLKPGESFVTYVPTGTTGVEELSGELAWRLHFRKGYSPSKRGVTTLIEIRFASQRIQDEPSRRADDSTAAL